MLPCDAMCIGLRHTGAKILTIAGRIICAMVESRVLLGMGDLPPLIGNPYNGYINPYGIGLMSLSPIIWK